MWPPHVWPEPKQFHLYNGFAALGATFTLWRTTVIYSFKLTIHSFFAVNHTSVHFVNAGDQWRTQKIFMGGFWFRVIWWSFVFGVRYLWRHNLTSFPCFQTNVLATFLDIVMHIFLHPLPLFHVALHWIWTISGTS